MLGGAVATGRFRPEGLVFKVPVSVDEVNRPTWSRYAPTFARADAWTDIGERLAIHAIASRIRNRRILDVGVGAGRTAWLLPLLSDSYVAVDYTKEMVELCREAHPDLDIRLADARDLSEFDDESFDLVVFSFNGLDALGHEDRARALSEFRRVLAPGGLLLFSSLDKAGPGFGQKPWHVRRRRRSRPVRRAVRFALLLPMNLPRYVREYRNWWRIRRNLMDCGGWGISHLAAHEYGLLVHYITPDEQRAELDRLGFDVEMMIGDDGEPVTTGPNRSRLYFHTIARKRSSVR